MKHLAVLSLACAIWLASRKRRKPSLSKSVTNETPLAVSRPGGPAVIQRAHGSVNASAAQALPAPAPAAATSAAPSKSVTSAVFQWSFLILLGAALSLAAARGAWDVFAVLAAAAVLQLGCQLMRWLECRGRGKTSRGSSAASLARRAAGAVPVVGSEVAVPTAPRMLVAPNIRLGGVWVKDPSRSDSMDEAASALRLNGIVRTAVRLIRGLELDPEALKAGRFDLAIFSVIAFFKVRESYPLDGTAASYNRRDLRRGKHTAFVAVQPDGSIVLSVSWGEPLAGTGTDHFAVLPASVAHPGAAEGMTARSGTAGQLPMAAPLDKDLLMVTSTIRLAEAARPVVYRTTYVRGGRGRHHPHPHPHSHHQFPGPDLSQ